MEKNQDKGFTLVELLIVIVILGILATVTVFAVRGITDPGPGKRLRTSRRAHWTRQSRPSTLTNQADPAVG